MLLFTSIWMLFFISILAYSATIYCIYFITLYLTIKCFTFISHYTYLLDVNSPCGSNLLALHYKWKWKDWIETQTKASEKQIKLWEIRPSSRTASIEGREAIWSILLRAHFPFRSIWTWLSHSTFRTHAELGAWIYRKQTIGEESCSEESERRTLL